MKKNPRKVRWTGAFRRTHGKELLVDSTFDFERKQNRPIRYDRNLYLATIKAMKRIQEIRLRRERLHYKKRIYAAKAKLNYQIAKVCTFFIRSFFTNSWNDLWTRNVRGLSKRIAWMLWSKKREWKFFQILQHLKSPLNALKKNLFLFNRLQKRSKKGSKSRLSFLYILILVFSFSHFILLSSVSPGTHISLFFSLHLHFSQPFSFTPVSGTNRVISPT